MPTFKVVITNFGAAENDIEARGKALTADSEFKGVVVPIIVPVDEDDCTDKVAFRKQIRYLVEGGVHALFVGGTAGEGPLLTLKEWARMMETAIDEVKGAIPLLGGVMDTSTKRVVEKIRMLADLGYRAFAVTPTFYLALRSADEHLRLFGACREAAPGMEMVAYNIPSATGSEISAATLIEMASRGWIRYCKDSSGNWSVFTRLCSEGQGVGLRVLMGTEENVARALVAGAAGVVPVCANVEPQTYVAAYEAALRGDQDMLAHCQKRIDDLRETLLLAGSCWLAGVKYAQARRGIGSGRPVSPLEPLTAAQMRRVDERLAVSV